MVNYRRWITILSILFIASLISNVSPPVIANNNIANIDSNLDAPQNIPPQQQPPKGCITFRSGGAGGVCSTYIMNMEDGSEPIKLMEHPGTDYCYNRSLSWSPDGKYVTYVISTIENSNNRMLYYSLFMASFDGKEGKRLTDGPNDFSPSVSPDGESIAFVMQPWYGGDRRLDDGIFTINKDGTERTRLTNISKRGYGGGGESWSPDGKYITFGDHTNNYLGLIKIETGEVIELYDTYADSPVWSPDGSQIAFSAWNRDIYVMNTQDKQVTQLTNFENWDDLEKGDNCAISWSPDSTFIIFTHYFHGTSNDKEIDYDFVYLANVETGQLTKLENLSGFGKNVFGRNAVWAPEPLCTSIFGRPEKPIITHPLQMDIPDATSRVLQCETDVLGTAEAGSTIHLWQTNSPPMPSQEDDLPVVSTPQEVGVVSVADGGTWAIPQVSLEQGENYLYAVAGKDELESDPSDYVHIVCGKPQVIYSSPPDDIDDEANLVLYDLSEGPSIAFRFDVPMDFSINK